MSLDIALSPLLIQKHDVRLTIFNDVVSLISLNGLSLGRFHTIYWHTADHSPSNVPIGLFWPRYHGGALKYTRSKCS